MKALLRDLRTLIEHEIDLSGPLVPLAKEEAPSTGPDCVTPTPADSDADAAPSTDRPELSGDASAEPPTPSEPAVDARADNDAPDDVTDSPSSMPNYDLFGNQVDPTEDPSLPPSERIEALIPDDAPYKEMKTLDEVRDYVASTVLIPIDEDRENPVFGVGDPNADLVVIGEAPGRDEDKHGEPFVGRSGQLLDKILEAINFTRDEIYITNIMKSRPPRNRDPEPEEIEAHIPILYKQIALIQPKIMLCVGKVAANTLLDRRSSLGSLREKEHDFYGIPVIVTYHPAALLRNPQWKRPTWDDVKLLRTRYDQLTEDS